MSLQKIRHLFLCKVPYHSEKFIIIFTPTKKSSYLIVFIGLFYILFAYFLSIVIYSCMANGLHPNYHQRLYPPPEGHQG